MDETAVPLDGTWVPQACTLPTVRRPLRRSEFDGLFTSAVRSVERVDQLRLRLELVPEPAVAARAADLLVRETECCSFFTFTLTATGGRVSVEVAVPAGHVDVLDALADRAGAGAGAGS
ncbi:MAG: hypothetical protein GEV12_00725 [Micromonosporaceae bacterium]|nr:hypothetical protein [Micromonosporaceae bacterium]